MQISFFDIHSHLNIAPLSERVDELVDRLKDECVGTIVVGVDLETSKKACELAEKYDNIWACIGMHPADNLKEEFDADQYRTLAALPKVVAIGECGLDYFRGKSADMIARQKEVFEKQIAIAKEFRKPLMIHARPSKDTADAYEDVLDILEKHESVHAHFHFFVGSVEIAKRALARGFTFSFDGPITFSSDYDEVIKMLPLENIMLETDAPFAAPAPYRGKTCEPWMVVEMYKKVAELKNLSLEGVQKQVAENAKRAFDLG